MAARTCGRAAALLVLLAFGACRSADPDLGMTAPTPSTASAAAPMPATAAAGGTPIQFLPVVGIPDDKAALLSQALARSAGAAGVTILPSAAGAAPRRLKGYLSTVREPADTLVIFVWDVVDPAGERLSRIQDQIRLPGTGADGWSVVGADALAQVADRTIAALQAPGDDASRTN